MGPVKQAKFYQELKNVEVMTLREALRQKKRTPSGYSNGTRDRETLMGFREGYVMLDIDLRSAKKQGLVSGDRVNGYINSRGQLSIRNRQPQLAA